MRGARARELGIVIGELEPGPLNAITDVAGTRVGHTTLVAGDDVRTGVTVVVPTGDGSELTKISAMAKLYCTDVAMEVTTDAVQVLGGYGYIQEYPVERMMRDAKITQIYEGTQQIQRLVISRALVGRWKS